MAPSVSTVARHFYTTHRKVPNVAGADIQPGTILRTRRKGGFHRVDDLLSRAPYVEDIVLDARSNPRGPGAQLSMHLDVREMKVGRGDVNAEAPVKGLGDAKGSATVDVSFKSDNGFLFVHSDAESFDFPPGSRGRIFQAAAQTLRAGEYIVMHTFRASEWHGFVSVSDSSSVKFTLDAEAAALPAQMNALELGKAATNHGVTVTSVTQGMASFTYTNGAVFFEVFKKNPWWQVWAKYPKIPKRIRKRAAAGRGLTAEDVKFGTELSTEDGIPYDSQLALEHIFNEEPELLEKEPEKLIIVDSSDLDEIFGAEM